MLSAYYNSLLKGVLGFESGWIGRLATGQEKKKMEPPTKFS